MIELLPIAVYQVTAESGIENIPDNAVRAIFALDRSFWVNPKAEVTLTASADMNDGNGFVSAGGASFIGGDRFRVKGDKRKYLVSEFKVQLLPGTNRKIKAAISMDTPVKTGLSLSFETS